MYRRFRTARIAGVCAAALGAACASASDSPATSKPAATQPAASQPASAPAEPRHKLLPTGRKAPRFDAWTIGGAYVRFPEDYRGQLVLLHFWASWCPSSARDYPFWVKAQDEYGALGLTLLGVSVDYQKNLGPDAVQAAMDKRGGTWDVIYQDAQKLERMYITPALPTLYLVDGDTGKIVDSGDDLRRGRLLPTLQKHLAEKFPDRFPESQPTSQPTSAPATQPTTTPAGS